jgi:hypothetical protein
MSGVKAMLAIDSGIEGGYAWFPSGSKLPLKCGLFGLIGNCDGGLIYQKRTIQVVDRFFDVLEEELGPFRPAQVYCEWPVIFRGGGSMAAEGSGSLIKLAYWVGHFAGVLSQKWPSVEFVPVEPNEWKGQLSKKMVEQRLQTLLGGRLWLQLKPKSHAIDAVGIGCWARGIF